MLGSGVNEMTNSLTDWMDGWNGRHEGMRGMNQNKAMKEGRNEGVKA